MLDEKSTLPVEHGVDSERLHAILEAAEPKRRAALAATLNLMVGIGLFSVQGGWFGGGIVMSLAAGFMIALMLWPLSNRLWRDMAIGTIAPAIGEGWGQTEFASGWGAVDLGIFFADLFHHEGARFTAWVGAGRYRDTAYRLSETSLWEKRHSDHKRTVRHTLVVEIAVPVPFSGTVELQPFAGVMSRIDGLLRKATGEEQQPLSIDPQFDALFDTLVSANASVDKLLTPSFRRVMLALAERHSDSRFTARFEHGWLTLRLPVDHLVVASARLTKPMPALAAEADMLWWDLTMPHRLINGLMGDPDVSLR